MTRMRTIDVHIGWLIIAATVAAITGLIIWTSSTPAPPTEPTTTVSTTGRHGSIVMLDPTRWPQVTRTVEGSQTVVMPEDLDRP